MRLASTGHISRLLVLLACALPACGDADAALDTNEDPVRDDCACRLAAQIDNLALCVSPSTAFAPPHVYSSSRSDASAPPTCEAWRAPQPVPSTAWSALRISAPCAGQGKLCITLRAGRVRSPSADDCVLVERCLDFAYENVGHVVELPALAAWVAESSECALRNEQIGSYYEFRLDSDQLGCATEAERVTRVAVCPARCESNPQGEGCDVCGRPQIMTWF